MTDPSLLSMWLSLMYPTLNTFSHSPSCVPRSESDPDHSSTLAIIIIPFPLGLSRQQTIQEVLTVAEAATLLGLSFRQAIQEVLTVAEEATLLACGFS